MLKPCKVCKRQPKFHEVRFGQYGTMYTMRCMCCNEEIYDSPRRFWLNPQDVRKDENLFERKNDAAKYWNAHH